MSVTLVSYPVTISSGKVQNIFAGYNPIELIFSRQDDNIVDVSLGTDNKALVSIGIDITGYLNVGEWIYIYSSGLNYTYDGVFQILDIDFSSPNTEILIDTDFIEASTGGYCNYKQNYYLEAKIVDPDNNAVRVYPQLLQNDGNPNGTIEVNVSMVVDFLKSEIKETSQELTTGRKQCKIMYREVFREDTNDAFVLVDENPIIVVFAAEQINIETFINAFEIPKMWAGYPFCLNFAHSLQNEPTKRVQITFDELDINKDIIVEDNILAYFEALDYGFLQANFADNEKIINDNTRFLTFYAKTNSLPDYQTGDYDDNEYLTINS